MIEYWVMDGRANYDIDKALVHVSCNSFKEAKGFINDFGADTCIVKVWSHKVMGKNTYEIDKEELVYSLLWKE